MLVLVKVRRTTTRTFNPDNYVDIARMPGLRRSSPVMFDALHYDEIWVVDFEFVANDGERPEPGVSCCLGTAERAQSEAMA